MDPPSISSASSSDPDHQIADEGEPDEYNALIRQFSGIDMHAGDQQHEYAEDMDVDMAVEPVAEVFQDEAQQVEEQVVETEPETDELEPEPEPEPESEPECQPELELKGKITNTIYGELWDALYGHKKVAVKITNLGRIRRTSFENPVEEVKVMRRLTEAGGHDNILLFHDANNDELKDQLFMITEFLQGGDLFESIRNCRPDTPTAKRWFTQIASALRFVHQNGFCHLDLSAENIMIADGRCVIIDFGMAKPCTAATTFPGRRVGKVGYMSPECFKREDFNGLQSDCYSLGILLFVLVTGLPPYNQGGSGGPHETDKRFRLIYSGRTDILLRAWGFTVTDTPNANNPREIDARAVDLIQRLVCPREVRYNIDQVLQHPWLCNES